MVRSATPRRVAAWRTVMKLRLIVAVGGIPTIVHPLSGKSSRDFLTGGGDVSGWGAKGYGGVGQSHGIAPTRRRIRGGGRGGRANRSGRALGGRGGGRWRRRWARSRRPRG